MRVVETVLHRDDVLGVADGAEGAARGRPDARQLVVKPRTAPGPASPMSRRPATLRHISAGRQCSSPSPATIAEAQSETHT